MGKTKKHILFPVLVLVFLIAACSPTPAATPDPLQIQQFIKDSVASTVAAEKAQTTEVQLPITTEAPTSGFNSVADLEEAAASPTSTPEPPTLTPNVEEAAFDTYCGPKLETQAASGEIKSINKLVSHLDGAKTAVIKQRVNLRTRPSLSNRILLVLKPDMIVEIIDGPVKTSYGNGYSYIWWKVKLPGGLTGWAVEVSACRQYYFMEAVN